MARPFFVLPFALAIACASTTGCAPCCACDGTHSAFFRTRYPGLFSALQPDTRQADEEREALQEAETAAIYAPHVPSLPPAVTPPDPVHVVFQPTVALAALRSIDLSPCAERAAPRGYGHAKVTFAGSGTVATVAIDSPADVPPDAAVCLRERLGSAGAPAFEGSPITVGVSYEVR